MIKPENGIRRYTIGFIETRINWMSEQLEARKPNEYLLRWELTARKYMGIRQY